MDTLNVTAGPLRLDTRRPLTIAVLAMGGQGGGVLVDWIVALAQAQGYFAQSTSVPGVAQRTGATIYYVEILAADGTGRRPVLSLMPAPGEIDIAIGAELMEAGRAIQRGLVSPDRTTLIASSHRAYAVSEKSVPGDGAGDSAEVYAAARIAAKRFFAFDMALIAEEAGSHISASLFGALAGSSALPFPRQAYEDTIRAGGIGVEASLRAFAVGHDRTVEGASGAPPAPPRTAVEGKVFPALRPVGHAGFDLLVERARSRLPEAAQPMVAAGLVRVVDFQDVAYGAEYLDLVEPFGAVEVAAGSVDYPMTRAAAKQIARAMAYDDVIRVADLKTRARRVERVRTEVAAVADQIVQTTEFMHPGMEEVCGTLPASIGLWIESRPRLFAALQRIVNRGRRVNTATLRWFLPLYALAGMRAFRRGTLRHRREQASRDAWLERAHAVAQHDIPLAIEVLEARGLVKGYSDTRGGGESKFERVVTMVPRLEGREDAAVWARRLRQAALADADGMALAGTIKTIESFLDVAH
jgi:indolepyruvate ferredoxin oxidoreductase beta subunit